MLLCPPPFLLIPPCPPPCYLVTARQSSTSNCEQACMTLGQSGVPTPWFEPRDKNSRLSDSDPLLTDTKAPAPLSVHLVLVAVAVALLGDEVLVVRALRAVLVCRGSIDIRVGCVSIAGYTLYFQRCMNGVSDLPDLTIHQVLYVIYMPWLPHVPVMPAWMGTATPKNTTL